MSFICNITDISQGGVVFQKQLQKHVISGPFGLFYMPHNFTTRIDWSGYLCVNLHMFIYRKTVQLILPCS